MIKNVLYVLITDEHPEWIENFVKNIKKFHKRFGWQEVHFKDEERLKRLMQMRQNILLTVDSKDFEKISDILLSCNDYNIKLNTKGNVVIPEIYKKSKIFNSITQHFNT